MKSILKTSYILLSVFLLMTLSCSRKPNIEPQLRGSWTVKRENNQFVMVFKDKGAWTYQSVLKGSSPKAEPKRKKIDGLWKIEYSKEKKKLTIVITPTEAGDDETWVKDKPVEFEVVEITQENLTLKDSEGNMETWKKIGDKGAEGSSSDSSLVTLNLEPIVVNLQKSKPEDKDRYFCVNIGLSIEDPKGLEYVSITSEKKHETLIMSYHLHPRIRDVAIGYFSSKMYKDTMTMIKLKEVINEFKKMMNPYFEGRLKEVKIFKIIVTTNPDTAEEFEKLCNDEMKGPGSGSSEGESSKKEGGHGSSEGEKKAESGEHKKEEEGGKSDHASPKKESERGKHESGDSKKGGEEHKADDGEHKSKDDEHKSKEAEPKKEGH